MKFEDNTPHVPSGGENCLPESMIGAINSMGNKASLRAEMKRMRKELPPQTVLQAGEQLSQLFPMEECMATRTLYVYLSARNEVPTEPLVRKAWSMGIRTAAPVVRGLDMQFLYFDRFDLLQDGSFGIREPALSCSLAECAEAPILIPGLAYDRYGHRLGYGGGYYDRFLHREPAHRIIAPCYRFQLLDQIPSEPHDIPVHRILCDSGEIVLPQDL